MSAETTPCSACGAPAGYVCKKPDCAMLPRPQTTEDWQKPVPIAKGVKEDLCDLVTSYADEIQHLRARVKAAAAAMSPAQRVALDAELLPRLWALYDASRPIYSKPHEGVTNREFAAFFRAFADVPESQHP